MPSSPYIVSGTIYTSRGSVPNSIVIINSDIIATTDSEGKFILDLSNLENGYTSGSSYAIVAQDEFNKEYISDTITVSGESQTKNLFLDSRSLTNDLTRNSQTRHVILRDVANNPVTSELPLSVSSLERPLTQLIALKSGTQFTEYVGRAAPGTPTSEAKWRIEKWSYNASNTITSITFASGNAEFDKIWDNRATYNFS